MLLLIPAALIHYGLYVLALKLGLRGPYWVRFLRYAGLGLMWVFGLLSVLCTISMFAWGWSEVYPGAFLLCMAALGWPLWRAYRKFVPKAREDPTLYY